MRYSKISGLPIIDEDDAEGEVARIFDDYKQFMQTPYLTNFYKGMAVSPAALTIHWDFIRSAIGNLTLPESLVYMILYTIAASKECQYCSAVNELSCRMLGIDDDTINGLVKDLGSVSPQRIRAIISFALHTAHDPKGLDREDYERLRDYGLMDDEIVQIILVASLANYTNTMSDALKIEVDSMVTTALGR